METLWTILYVLGLLLLVLAVSFILTRIMPKILSAITSWALRRMMRKFFGNISGEEPKPRQRRRHSKPEPKPKPKRQGKIIPPEYGVDVEYTEVISHSEQVEIAPDAKTGDTHIKIEEQVSDAEWVEIKSKE